MFTSYKLDPVIVGAVVGVIWLFWLFSRQQTNRTRHQSLTGYIVPRGCVCETLHIVWTKNISESLTSEVMNHKDVVEVSRSLRDNRIICAQKKSLYWQNWENKCTPFPSLKGAICIVISSQRKPFIFHRKDWLCRLWWARPPLPNHRRTPPPHA